MTTNKFQKIRKKVNDFVADWKDSHHFDEEDGEELWLMFIDIPPLQKISNATFNAFMECYRDYDSTFEALVIPNPACMEEAVAEAA